MDGIAGAVQTGGDGMSCYAELKHARTEEEYREALAACMDEARQDAYYERLQYEHYWDDDEDEDEEEEP